MAVGARPAAASGLPQVDNRHTSVDCPHASARLPSGSIADRKTQPKPWLFYSGKPGVGNCLRLIKELLRDSDLMTNTVSRSPRALRLLKYCVFFTGLKIWLLLLFCFAEPLL